MLTEEIKRITEGVYPFHMPGHKRSDEWLDGLYRLDITEIAGADNLHAPEGIIAKAEAAAAALFGVKETVFMTGGSTAGVLSAITAASKRNEAIVIGRNCHKSVYNASKLNGLDTYYIYPEITEPLGVGGKVAPEKVAAAMDKSGAKTVVITSPTYEGIASDIKTIADEVHSRDGILIVDSAHGAHLGFNGYFPKSARHQGADIVIESAHKTLPCVTGAALLHICTDRVSHKEIRKQVSIFETSSPPYPIICSIDRFVERAKEEDLFTPYSQRLSLLYKECEKLEKLSVFRTDDPSKVIILTRGTNINGFELKKKLLKDYKIELEMAMPTYGLALSSLADSDEGFSRLISALFDIDKIIIHTKADKPLFPPEAIRGDYGEGIVSIPLDNAVGRISAEMVLAYPPGFPIIAEGEVFTAEIADYISYLYASGAHILSSSGEFPKFVQVFKERC